MVRRGAELRTAENKNMRGGDGTVLIRHFLNEGEFNGKGRLFSRITLDPGCSIGFHEHSGESEVFYIMSGSGVYSDGGEESAVSAGDVALCPPGTGHSIRCAGSLPLEICALILFE